jgi:urea transporter
MKTDFFVELVLGALISILLMFLFVHILLSTQQPDMQVISVLLMFVTVVCASTLAYVHIQDYKRY